MAESDHKPDERYILFFSQFKYFTTIVIIVLEFSVKASSDAHILLAPCDGCDGYEVVIGGRSNGLYLVSVFTFT